jgi:hypothetical protein
VKIISRDGIGLAAMVRAAEKVAEILDEFNVALGMIDDPVYGKAIALVHRDGKGDVLVTVEANPKIVQREEARGHGR